MSSVNKKFYSFLPISVPFISISCLIVSTKTSSMMLKRSGERAHAYLVLVLSGKASSLPPLSIMLAVGFLVDHLYQVEKVSLSS